MSKSTPSLLALLGLVAVAGYQNRGRISDMLSDARQKSADLPHVQRPPGEVQPEGGFLSEISQLFATGAAGTTLSTGLNELVNRFRAAGRAAPADSWVSAEANMPIDLDELEAAIGHETLDDLAAKTGLSQRALLLRLNAALPEVVNRFTPHGRVPTEPEARAFD
ncbi:MAG: YidB family protein [Paracoccaceae bacterium]